MWSKEQQELIKRTVAEGTTDDEFRMFLHYCEKSGLDPLRKQAHCIVREWKKRDGQQHRDVNMMTGIDGFRARAETMPDYLGCQSAVVYDSDEFAIDFGASTIHHVAKFPRPNDGKIVGAWCIVRRQERPQYIHWLAWQELFDGRSPTHQKMPEVMAKKTAEAQAIRHEYPEPFSGIYDLAEVPTAEGDKILSEASEEATPVAQEPRKIAPPKTLPEVAPPKAAKNPPTKRQVDRLKALVLWGGENNLLPPSWDDTQIHDVEVWATAPDRTASEVGAKIGTWKDREKRHGLYSALYAEVLDKYADDEEVTVDIQLAHQQWVMHGEGDFAEYCDTSLPTIIETTD